MNQTNKIHILMSLLLCFVNIAKGQNYIQYQKTFNSIDQDIADNKYSQALIKLDSINQQYQFVYAKHCIKGLQICVKSGDSFRAQTWLARCMKQGIPMWYLRNNTLTNLALSYSNCNSTINHYDSLHAIYIKNIHYPLRKTIDSLMVYDQKYTQRMNNGFILLRYSVYYLQWRHYNKKQFKFVRHLIETYGFPDERLIGLPILEDSAQYAKHLHFWGPSEIRNASIQIMLQHCYSTSHKIDTGFINLLKHNQMLGNTSAFQVAIVSDFMYGNKKKHLQFKYLYHTKKQDSDLNASINLNRSTLGLNTLEQDKTNDGIDMSRRKTKTADSEIVLE